MTEMITGIDLIKEQIRVAQGAELRFKQEDIEMKVGSITSKTDKCKPWHVLMPRRHAHPHWNCWDDTPTKHEKERA